MSVLEILTLIGVIIALIGLPVMGATLILAIIDLIEKRNRH